jgi:hypothetical protein
MKLIVLAPFSNGYLFLSSSITSMKLTSTFVISFERILELKDAIAQSSVFRCPDYSFIVKVPMTILWNLFQL